MKKWVVHVFPLSSQIDSPLSFFIHLYMYFLYCLQRQEAFSCLLDQIQSVHVYHSAPDRWIKVKHRPLSRRKWSCFHLALQLLNLCGHIVWMAPNMSQRSREPSQALHSCPEIHNWSNHVGGTQSFGTQFLVKLPSLFSCPFIQNWMSCILH